MGTTSAIAALDIEVRDFISKLLSTMPAGWDVRVVRSHDWTSLSGKFQRGAAWIVEIYPHDWRGAGSADTKEEAAAKAEADLPTPAHEALADFRRRQNEEP